MLKFQELLFCRFHCEAVIYINNSLASVDSTAVNAEVMFLIKNNCFSAIAKPFLAKHEKNVRLNFWERVRVSI